MNSNESINHNLWIPDNGSKLPNFQTFYKYSINNHLVFRANLRSFLNQRLIDLLNPRREGGDLATSQAFNKAAPRSGGGFFWVASTGDREEEGVMLRRERNNPHCLAAFIRNNMADIVSSPTNIAPEAVEMVLDIFIWRNIAKWMLIYI